MENFCTAEGTKFGAVEDENFGTVQGGNFHFFLILGRFLKILRKTKKKHTFFQFDGAAEDGKVWDR